MRSNFIIVLTLIGGMAHAAETVMETIALQNRPATEIQPLLQPLLENGDVVVENGFELIVKTSPERLESIRGLISKLDRRQHNLIVSVLDNSHKTASELNAEAAIAITSSSVHMRGMNASTHGHEDRRNLQQLRTLEGQAAHIETGNIRQLDNISVYSNGYGYPIISNQTQMQQATSGFAVVPRLIGDQEVQLNIEPWSERFLPGGAMSITNTSTAVRARLGEWVEIAGTNSQSQENRNGGFNGMNHMTRDDQVRILLKVDLAN